MIIKITDFYQSDQQAIVPVSLKEVTKQKNFNLDILEKGVDFRIDDLMYDYLKYVRLSGVKISILGQGCENLILQMSLRPPEMKKVNNRDMILPNVKLYNPREDHIAYGTLLLKNRKPFGDWVLKLHKYIETEPLENRDSFIIEDIIMFLHVTHQVNSAEDMQ